MKKKHKDIVALCLFSVITLGVLFAALVPILGEYESESLKHYFVYNFPFFLITVPIAGIAATSFFFGKEHVLLAGKTLQTLRLKLSDPPTKNEVQQIVDKIDDLLEALKKNG